MNIRADSILHPNAEIKLLRLDLINKDISGNKWFKLLHNIKEAKNIGKTTLLTFGGAYSNHIYATAAAAKKEGLKSIGVIRGEETLPINPTLTFVKNCGMNLQYVSRSDYRRKATTDFQNHLKRKFGDFYLIPEGGSNLLAVKGVAEIISYIGTDYDYFATPVGTGGTIAGIISGLNGKSFVLGFPALKGAEGLEKDIFKLLSDTGQGFNNWKLINNYHFGGYAKFDRELYQFIKDFKKNNNILLDPIYTGKMMFGLFDLLNNGFFPKGCKILALHTGGLQGWSGMKSRYKFIDSSFSFD